MVVYTLIGEPKMGKTFFTKNILMKKYEFCIVWDPNNTDFKELPFWDFKKKKGHFRVCPQMPINGKIKIVTFKQFYTIFELVTNCCLVCEESTTFLEGNLPKDLGGMLTRRRHRGNRFVFIYHSFRQIPPKASVYSDYFIQFKTNNTEGNVCKTKFKDVPDIYDNKIYLDTAKKYSYKVTRLSSMAHDNII